jgi:hypothetical protein
MMLDFVNRRSGRRRSRAVLCCGSWDWPRHTSEPMSTFHR